jgi:hypothetical protein
MAKNSVGDNLNAEKGPVEGAGVSLMVIRSLTSDPRLRRRFATACGQALEPRGRLPAGPQSTPLSGYLSSWAHCWEHRLFPAVIARRYNLAKNI